VVGPYRHSKLMFTRLSNFSHDVPTIAWDMETVSKMSAKIAMGLL
jgi:hypothetical protein